VIPLARFSIGRSIHIPSPFPGLWNYWRESPPERGKGTDRLRLQNLERLQLLVRSAPRSGGSEEARAVAVEAVRVLFATER
jgi:hypothetical protein